jgi:hypothetical protein
MSQRDLRNEEINYMVDKLDEGQFNILNSVTLLVVLTLAYTQ